MKRPLLWLALITGTLTSTNAADKPRLAELGELDQPIERLETSAVVLPETLKKSGQDDTVTMTAIVSAEGRVTRIEQLKSATPEGGAAASEAVKKWLFARAFAKGEPVSFALPVAVALRPSQATDEAADRGASVGVMGGALMTVAEPKFEWIPEYPAALQASPVNGYALVSVLVGEDGKASDAVTEFASRTEFSAPAAAVVPTWIFAPTVSGGKPIATRTTVRVDFSAKSATSTAAERDMESRLRYARDYDEGPREKSSKPVVFPYDALISDKQGGVTLSVIVTPDGRVAHVVPDPGSDPDFVSAARASLAWWEFFPATKAGLPVFGLIKMQLTFDPLREEFEFDESTLALISALRAGTAEVLSLKQVDQFPKPVNQVVPRFPLDHEGSLAGDASIECIIDTSGRPQLPRVVRASSPEFGWAAATAVAQWRFEPARKGGEPVTARARLPIRVTSEAPPAARAP